MHKYFVALLFLLSTHVFAEDINYAGQYAIDNTHAYIGFSYNHLGFSKPILYFRTMDGALHFDEQNPRKSRVNITIDATSIDTGVPIFDDHLRDKKHFFNTKEHPKIRFRSTSIKALKGDKYQLRGNLTIKGVTRPVTLKATLNKKGIHPFKKVKALGFSATGTLKRSDWKLNYAVPNVSDQVGLTIEIEFHGDKP